MNSLKPSSRLIIFFILAVVLSGSVLTSFSINNISNLKELTEKRIIEEQRELSARFLSAIQKNLENITAGFDEEPILISGWKDSLNKTIAGNDFIVQPFILKNNGQFLYPNFTGIPENEAAFKLSERFRSAFSAGEKAEFAERDFKKAREYYKTCAVYSTGSHDSVKSLNALGRISAKLKDNINAVNYYILIISEYSTITDENGIPYSYYALPALLKITNPDNREKILKAVESFLEGMEAGSIPLNFNTEDLITPVKEWSEDNIVNYPEKSAVINQLISSIRQQIRFINSYRIELPEILRKANSGNQDITVNDFIIIKPVTGTDQEYFLINTGFENPAGFLIDSKKLLDTIAKSDLQSGFEFNYKIRFPTVYNADAASDKLVYSSQLNPYFPEQILEIRLSDETLINDIVKRRSWIYGIASVFLLVAMLLGIILILRDITREKHLARLRSDFISNVTHELKTPLTSIQMYAESLLMGRVKTPDGQKEYLEVVVNESERLKRMINNILEYSKMEKGKPEYHFVNSNLASILKSSLQEMNYWLEKENFDIVTELDEKISAEVDPEKMKQAIGNLLSNAIKYSTDTKIISVRLFQKSDHVCIEVEDRGIGIPDDNLSRIFEEFYRIEQKESISGTGLGLTVVKEIIEAHSGTITVTSETGKGSKFVITLNQQAVKGENNISN